MRNLLSHQSLSICCGVFILLLALAMPSTPSSSTADATGAADLSSSTSSAADASIVSTTSAPVSGSGSLLLLVSFDGNFKKNDEPSPSPSLTTTQQQGVHKIRVAAPLLELMEPLTSSSCSTLLKERIPELEDQRFHIEIYNTETSKYEECSDDTEQLMTRRNSNKNRLMILIVGDNEVATEGQQVIEGKAFSIEDGKVPFGDSSFIHINTLHGEREAQDGATGMSTWDAAVVLAKYLELNPHLVGERSKNVLELGAGTGLAGIAAASLGAKTTVLTDLAYTTENLLQNVILNSHSERGVIQGGADVAVMELDWTRRETYLLDTEWDVIVAADVVWLAHLVPPLLQAIEAHTSENTELIISHQMRSTACDTLLFDGLEKIFTCEQIAVDAHHHEYRSPKINIYRCKRRPKS